MREHVLVGPPGGPISDPVAEVAALAPYIDECIDRSAAPLNLPARAIDRATAQSRFGLCVIHPVATLVVVRVEIAKGHLKAQRVIRSAGLEHQDRIRSGLRQTAGKHAARGARAHDDVVVVHRLAGSLAAPEWLYRPSGR